MVVRSRTFPASLRTLAGDVYGDDAFRRHAIIALSQCGHVDDCVEHLPVPEDLPESFYGTRVQLAGFFRLLQDSILTCITAARTSGGCSLALERKISALGCIRDIAIERLAVFLECETVEDDRTYGIITGWTCQLVNLYQAIAINRDPVVGELHSKTELCEMVRVSGRFRMLDTAGISREKRDELTDDFYDTAERMYNAIHGSEISPSAARAVATFISDHFGDAFDNGTGDSYEGEHLAKMLRDLLNEYGELVLLTDPILHAMQDLGFFKSQFDRRRRPDYQIAELPDPLILASFQKHLKNPRKPTHNSAPAVT